MQLQSMLLPPLSFHGASSSNRMRRNRRISSSLTVDADGSERMIVRFWVEGQVPDNGEEEYWWDTVKKWVGPLIWEDSERPGSYVPTPTHPKPPPPPPPPEPAQTWGGWVAGGLSSVFGGLVPRVKVGEDGKPTTGGAALFKRARKPALGEFSTGEAIAELKKVGLAPVILPESVLTFLLSQDPATGHFVYQQLYVSIPGLSRLLFSAEGLRTYSLYSDARHPNAYRINIPTDVVEPGEKGLDRLRFWRRSKVVAA